MNKLQRAKPCETGVNPKAITALINELAEKKVEIHSMMILRHGKVIAEGWYKPYRPEYHHMMFSLSKSFTSTAIGFAVQEGLLSTEDFVLNFFKDMLPCEPCENMKKMKVKHLLSMATGHDKEPEILNFSDGQWVYKFLTSYVAKEPGSIFVYNTPATYMLSAIIKNVTGMNLTEYLRPRLLDPIGISKDAWCEKSPEGIEAGGFGFFLQTEDIAKFGIFLINRGSFNGKQLLDAGWIDEATRKQINSDLPNIDWNQGYCYQYWRSQPEGSYRADGAFGQFCLVLPKEDMIFAITAGTEDTQTILSAIWDNIIPNIHESIEENKSAQEEMEKILANLELSVPRGSDLDTVPELKNYSGKTYQLSANPVGIESVCFNFGKESTMTVNIGGKESILTIGCNDWADSLIDIAIPQPLTVAATFGEKTTMFEKVSVKGTWLDGKLSLIIVNSETPFHDTWNISFDEKGLTAEYSRNVNFTPIQCRIFGR